MNVFIEINDVLVVNGVIGCNAKPCNDSHYWKW